MDSDPVQQTSTTNVNGTRVKANGVDEDEQAVFLNNCIKNETIDFEKSAQDKLNAKIDGKIIY